MTKTPITYFEALENPFRPVCSIIWWKHWWTFATRIVWEDLYTFWHRGRYGWAPDDLYNLDTYLARVMGQTLQAIGEKTYGAPWAYPVKPDDIPDDPNTIKTDFDAWRADVTKWGKALEAVTDYKLSEEHNPRVENELYNTAQEALKDLAPWFGHLWI